MSLPVWTALTAYGLTAIVTKTVPDNTTWWVTVPGTSGAVEPTWPTTDPWTVVDGTVTWGLIVPSRTNMVAGLLSILTTFKNSNPTLLADVSATRPRSLTNASMPFAYVTDRDESDISEAHMMQRTFSNLGIVLVDVTPSNAEAEARMDILVDGIVALVAKYYHAGGANTITQMTGVTTIDVPEEGLYAVMVNVGDTFQTVGTD